MQPDSAKSTDPSQQQSQAILKFLPFMIGYFSLNVPAGLTLYWFFNNIITTTQTVYLRKTTKPLVNVGGNGTAGNGGAASSQPVRVDYVPKRERRSGATIPKAAAPKIDVSNAISAEFTDFDDGPAKVKSALEASSGILKMMDGQFKKMMGVIAEAVEKAVEEATERRNAGVPIILFHQYSFSLYEKSALEFRIRSRGSIAIASICWYQTNFISFVKMKNTNRVFMASIFSPSF